MQEEARCEQQSNGAWRVWLHPSGREVAVYSEEEEAIDVAELLNLKIKLDARLPVEGLTDDLDAGQIELVANMPMEELLQVVVPEEVDMDPDDAVNTAQKSEIQRTAQEEDKKDSQDLENESINSDEDDFEPAAVHRGIRSSRWKKNADGSFSKIMGRGQLQNGRRICSWALNDEVRTAFVVEDSTDVVFVHIAGPTGEQQEFNVALRAIHSEDESARNSTNTLGKGRHLLDSALSLKQGDVVTLSKGPVMGQVYISVDRCRILSSRKCGQSRVSAVLSTDSEEELSEQEKPSVKSQHFWHQNSDGSYSKILPATAASLSLSKEMKSQIFGDNSSKSVVLITKSSKPKLDNRRFESGFANSTRYIQLTKGIANLLRFLKAKQGHIITLSKGPAAGQAFISTEVNGLSCPEAPSINWTKNSDGSYSKQLTQKFGNKGNISLYTSPEIRRELIRHKNSDFILIIKSADPDLDGKRFPVGYGASQWKSAQTRVYKGFFSVNRCLNLQPSDIITLSKGPNIGEVYISVSKGRRSLTAAQMPTSPCGDLPGAAEVSNGRFDDGQAPMQIHHNSPKSPTVPDVDRQQQRQQPNTASAAAESHGGGIQKRQLPSSSRSDLQARPPAKRNKTYSELSSTVIVGHQQLHESDVAPETVVQGAAERRSLPEMLALVKSIIEKEAVGLSAVERISYRTKFMIKMTPEIRVSSLQMLEELDGAGEHDGVKLCVQMSLQDLN